MGHTSDLRNGSTDVCTNGKDNSMLKMLPRRIIFRRDIESLVSCGWSIFTFYNRFWPISFIRHFHLVESSKRVLALTVIPQRVVALTMFHPWLTFIKPGFSIVSFNYCEQVVVSLYGALSFSYGCLMQWGYVDGTTAFLCIRGWLTKHWMSCRHWSLENLWNSWPLRNGSFWLNS